MTREQGIFKYFLKVVPTTFKRGFSAPLLASPGCTGCLSSKLQRARSMSVTFSELGLLLGVIRWQQCWLSAVVLAVQGSADRLKCNPFVGRGVATNQFSVTEYDAAAPEGSMQLPAVWFLYDLSPISVDIQERHQSFLHFLTRVCAVIGGGFAVTGALQARADVCAWPVASVSCCSSVPLSQEASLS